MTYGALQVKYNMMHYHQLNMFVQHVPSELMMVCWRQHEHRMSETREHCSQYFMNFAIFSLPFISLTHHVTYHVKAKLYHLLRRIVFFGLP